MSEEIHVEMTGSGLPSGSGGEASRVEGARESTTTETEAVRSSGKMPKQDEV